MKISLLNLIDNMQIFSWSVLMKRNGTIHKPRWVCVCPPNLIVSIFPHTLVHLFIRNIAHSACFMCVSSFKFVLGPQKIVSSCPKNKPLVIYMQNVTQHLCFKYWLKLASSHCLELPPLPFLCVFMFRNSPWPDQCQL